MFALVAVVFNSFIFVHVAHKSHTVNCDNFQDFGSNFEHREESHHDCHPRRYIAFCFMHTRERGVCLIGSFSYVCPVTRGVQDFQSQHYNV